MSGCAHMNPAEWCASCIPEKYEALREENARLQQLADARAESLEACMESDAKHRAEVARLEGLIMDWINWKEGARWRLIDEGPRIREREARNA